MKIIEQRGRLEDVSGSILALGYFDGVHLGHQKVLRQALAVAAKDSLVPAVFTLPFEAGVRLKGKAVCSAGQKHRLLDEMGFAYCLEPPFSSFCGLAPAAYFEEMLVGEYRARALVCGGDYTFGAARAGTIDVLRDLCQAHGVALYVVETALWQGQPVSSSRIRAALEEGDIPSANAMLGRPYEIDFPVRHGQGLGHTLGFPTLNQVFPASLQPPKQGVYITGTLQDGHEYPSATGFGPRPTVSDDKTTVTCETFIPGFQGDLYGQAVRVRFYEEMGETRKFSGPEELAKAVQEWARQAEMFFAEGREKQQ